MLHQEKTTRKVILVGAGPGRQDLITIAGFKAIQSADVILYDALVNRNLLKENQSNAELIYVGKRSGQHSLKQDEINQLLVEKAKINHRVIRLKGGDPFVFGRASEEIEYLESHGIHVELIPGISSALSVPSCQGIPLTKRGISQSFWVVTATTKEGSFPKDLQYASQSSATLIILMGIRKIHQITEFVSQHRPSLTPMAIIQNGTLPDEKCIITDLYNSPHTLSDLNPNEPGIIIIGDVVADHDAFYEEEIQRVLYSYI